ncbi:MAG: hypothetical protein WDO70_00935 [Alphaproteobacteria bacterium]
MGGFGHIPGPGDDFAVQHGDRAHRHLAAQGGGAGFLERDLHEALHKGRHGYT